MSPFSHKAGTVFAIDVGGTKVACGLYDRATGEWYARTRFPVRTTPINPDAPSPGPVLGVGAVADLLEAFVEHARPPQPVSGIHVSIAAALSEDGRLVRYAPNLPGWEGGSLVQSLESRFRAPAKLLQDGHATTLGEWGRGALRGVTNGLCVAIGTGIGGGIVANSALLSGADGLAGVFGHMPVLSEGRIVPLEQAAAGPGLARRARVAGLEADPASLFRDSVSGSPVAQALVSTALGELGQALASAVSLLNPERIVLAGTLGLVYATQAPTLRTCIRQFAQPTAARTARLLPAALGSESALWGAALAATDF